MENISVPSVLASEGLAANSFSMCFGPDGIGRINFGDKGNLDQGETPFNLESPHPTYNISMTQIIFDSCTSFTYLNEHTQSLVKVSIPRPKRYDIGLILDFLTNIATT